MTKEEREKAVALAEEAKTLRKKATPGPWTVYRDANEVRRIVSEEHETARSVFGAPTHTVCETPLGKTGGASMQFRNAPNAALIAHAGTHYATIARALIDANAEIERLRDTVKFHRTIVRAPIDVEPAGK